MRSRPGFAAMTSTNNIRESGGGVDLTSPRRHARSVVAARCFTLGGLARAQFGTHPGVASGHARAWEDRRLLQSVLLGGHSEEQRPPVAPISSPRRSLRTALHPWRRPRAAGRRPQPYTSSVSDTWPCRPHHAHVEPAAMRTPAGESHALRRVVLSARALQARAHSPR
jgi:hypothetical protein